MAPKIAVIFYSTYGHALTLAETAFKAVKETKAEVKLYQIPETLPVEVLAKLGAAPRRDDIPSITPADLKDYDGYIFVIPTRYGRAVSQFSQFFDATGALWAAGSLVGKFATIMSSTGTQNGGQETTALTTLPYLSHHGIGYVPFGYADPGMMNVAEIKGGAPWGAGTIAGADGSRQPSELELGIVSAHAKHFVGFMEQYVRGGERLNAGKDSHAAPVASEADAAHKSAEPEKTAGSSKEPKREDRQEGTSSTAASAPVASGSSGSAAKKPNRLSVHGITKGIKKLLSPTSGSAPKPNTP